MFFLLLSCKSVEARGSIELKPSLGFETKFMKYNKVFVRPSNISNILTKVMHSYQLASPRDATAVIESFYDVEKKSIYILYRILVEEAFVDVFKARFQFKQSYISQNEKELALKKIIESIESN